MVSGLVTVHRVLAGKLEKMGGTCSNGRCYKSISYKHIFTYYSNV